MKKNVFPVFFIALFLLSFFAVPPPSVHATTPPWLTGWNYRKIHYINPASGAGTNYVVNVTVNYGSGSDSAYNIYCNNHSRSDLADIRFTKADGVTLLSYYQEGSNFWVKIPDDISSVGTTIYIYYDKPSASSTSNGANVFAYYDSGDKGLNYFTQRNIYNSGFYGDFYWYFVQYGERRLYPHDDKDLWTINDFINSSNYEVHVTFDFGSSHPANLQAGIAVRYSISGLYYALVDESLTPERLEIRKELTPPNTAETSLAYTDYAGSDIYNSQPFDIWLKVQGTTLTAHTAGGLNGLGIASVTATDASLTYGTAGIFNAYASGVETAFWGIWIRNLVDPEPTQGAGGSEESVPSILSSITLNNPISGYVNNDNLTIIFEFTPVWLQSNINMKNATLYTNSVKVLQASLTNNTLNTVTYTYPVSGSYTWYIRLYNSTDYIQSETRTVNIIVPRAQSLLVSITLNSPANSTTFYTSPTSVNFTFTPIWKYMNLSIMNATLYVNGAAYLNTSALINATQNIITQSLTIALVPYHWYVRLYNSTNYIQSATWTIWFIQNLGVTITDRECGNWVFAEDKYYTFQGIFFPAPAIKTAEIGFYNDVNWIDVAYNKVSGIWYIINGSDLIRIKSGIATVNQYNLTTKFSIFFTSNVLDVQNVSISMRSNSTIPSLVSTGWELKQPNYFNVYNLGGLNYLTSVGDAGRITGGDVFELYANNASSVQVKQYWKYMKSVDLFFSVKIDPAHFYLGPILPIYTFGIDYYYNGGWVNGLYSASIELSYESGFANQSHLTDLADSMAFNVKWYYKNTLIKSEFMRAFGFWNGTNADPYVPVKIPLHIELWFNLANASSLIGGRVTAEYYAMTSEGSPWWSWITGLIWRQDNINPPNSLCFAALRDDGGNIFSSKNLKLMKLIFNVTQPSNLNTVTISAVDFNSFAVDHNAPSMSGINTPVDVEPRIVNMAQGGLFAWFAALFTSAFLNIGNIIWRSALINANLFVSFIDTLFSLAGWPNGFSLLLGYITNFLSWIVTGFGMLANFLAVAAVFTGGLFLSIFTQFIAFMAFIPNLWAFVVTLWSYADPFIGWIPGVLPSLMPLVYTCFMLWLLWPLLDKGNVQGCIQRIKDTIGTIWKIVEFMWRVGDFAFNLIYRLIQLIPVVE